MTTELKNAYQHLEAEHAPGQRPSVTAAIVPYAKVPPAAFFLPESFYDKQYDQEAMRIAEDLKMMPLFMRHNANPMGIDAMHGKMRAIVITDYAAYKASVKRVLSEHTIGIDGVANEEELDPVGFELRQVLHDFKVMHMFKHLPVQGLVALGLVPMPDSLTDDKERFQKIVDNESVPIVKAGTLTEAKQLLLEKIKKAQAKKGESFTLAEYLLEAHAGLVVKLELIPSSIAKAFKPSASSGLFLEVLITEGDKGEWPEKVGGLLDLQGEALFARGVQLVVFSPRYGAEVTAMLLTDDDAGQALSAAAESHGWDGVLQIPEFPAATGYSMVSALINLREKMREVPFTVSWLSKLRRATEALAKHSEYNYEAEKIIHIFEAE